jgi:ssDNA-binding replication factor A large subunit
MCTFMYICIQIYACQSMEHEQLNQDFESDLRYANIEVRTRSGWVDKSEILYTYYTIP